MRQALNRHRPFLSLNGASFRLGDDVVFERTSWVLHRDEQWAILGANGSGKSLLADALRGRLPLIEGELRCHFRAPGGLTAEEAIGLVSFEERRADVHDLAAQSRWNSLEEESSQSVREFLSYERVMQINPFEVTDRHRRGRPAFERRRRAATRLLDVATFLDRRLLSLSNGETQRVQLARALCQPLRLLILDEPFVGLDSATRTHFQQTLERLMATGLRIIVITTRPEDLPAHVTHLLCVDSRQVLWAGPRREIPARIAAVNQWKLGDLRQPSVPRRFASSGRLAFAAKKPVALPPRDDPGSGATELVRMRDVTVSYGEKDILRNLNWTVRAGESWALLGPNGSGKTTLLSLILGDNPQAYSNDVTVFGRQRGDGESIWQLKTRIGWVSPELHLHFDPNESCLAAVLSGFHDTIGLFEQPSSRQRAEARHWLARFELLDFERAPLAALSAGQQRMVLLARALVKTPPLLVLDEPCQGLDPAHRKDFLRAVEKLVRENSATVIYVTHRDDEIPPSIKKVLRLSRGGKTIRACPEPV
jgi:molybdate transport system ATP-binding protein